MEFLKHRLIIVVPVFCFYSVIGVFFWFMFESHEPKIIPVIAQETSAQTKSLDPSISTVSIPEDASDKKIKDEIIHIPLPDEVRGLYWNAATPGTSTLSDRIDFLTNHGLNTIVIDLKMDNGELAFVPLDSTLTLYTQSHPSVENIEQVLTSLAEKNIYRIARIPIMRDNTYARKHPEYTLKYFNGSLWQDRIGSLWLDPAVPQVSEYAIALAKEAYARGFDEVQFDYVRFPSDGSVLSIVYPVYDGIRSKVEVMADLFAHLGNTMQEAKIPVSFDLFGMTFWSTNDYNIGQRLLDAYPHADFVSPMVYPSHYPAGFRGYANPALYPYDIVKSSLDKGAEQLFTETGMKEEETRVHFRPWIQAFDIGAVYGSDRLTAQIQAARDAGASGWILWNARNMYRSMDYTLSGEGDLNRE